MLVLLLPVLRHYLYQERINRQLDTGAFAALLGYDAINAEGHGRSGSYTVVLNRTKVIFLDDSAREDSKDDGQITFQTWKDGVIYAIRNRKVIGWARAVEASPDNDDAEHQDGGPGSGNFGHEGRPGEVGGSGPAEYAGLSEEGRDIIKEHIRNPYHFGSSDEQKSANRQKLIRALSDIGADCAVNTALNALSRALPVQ